MATGDGEIAEDVKTETAKVGDHGHDIEDQKEKDELKDKVEKSLPVSTEGTFTVQHDDSNNSFSKVEAATQTTHEISEEIDHQESEPSNDGMEENAEVTNKDSFPLQHASNNTQYEDISCTTREAQATVKENPEKLEVVKQGPEFEPGNNDNERSTSTASEDITSNVETVHTINQDDQNDSTNEAEVTVKNNPEVTTVVQEKETEPDASSLTKDLEEPDKEENKVQQEDTSDSQKEAEGTSAESLETAKVGDHGHDIEDQNEKDELKDKVEKSLPVSTEVTLPVQHEDSKNSLSKLEAATQTTHEISEEIDHQESEPSNDGMEENAEVTNKDSFPLQHASNNTQYEDISCTKSEAQAMVKENREQLEVVNQGPESEPGNNDNGQSTSTAAEDVTSNVETVHTISQDEQNDSTNEADVAVKNNPEVTSVGQEKETEPDASSLTKDLEEPDKEENKVQQEDTSDSQKEAEGTSAESSEKTEAEYSENDKEGNKNISHNSLNLPEQATDNIAHEEKANSQEAENALYKGRQEIEGKQIEPDECNLTQNLAEHDKEETTVQQEGKSDSQKEAEGMSVESPESTNVDQEEKTQPDASFLPENLTEETKVQQEDASDIQREAEESLGGKGTEHIENDKEENTDISHNCLNSSEQVIDAKDLEVDSQDEAKEICKERQEIEDVAQEKQTEPYANGITKNLAEPDKEETQVRQEDVSDSQEKEERSPAEDLETAKVGDHGNDIEDQNDKDELKDKVEESLPVSTEVTLTVQHEDSNNSLSKVEAATQKTHEISEERDHRESEPSNDVMEENAEVANKDFFPLQHASNNTQYEDISRITSEAQATIKENQENIEVVKQGPESEPSNNDYGKSTSMAAEDITSKVETVHTINQDDQDDSTNEADVTVKNNPEITSVDQEKETEPDASRVTKDLAEPDKEENKVQQEDTSDSQKEAEGMSAESLEIEQETGAENSEIDKGGNTKISHNNLNLSEAASDAIDHEEEANSQEAENALYKGRQETIDDIEGKQIEPGASNLTQNLAEPDKEETRVQQEDRSDSQKAEGMPVESPEITNADQEEKTEPDARFLPKNLTYPDEEENKVQQEDTTDIQKEAEESLEVQKEAEESLEIEQGKGTEHIENGQEENTDIAHNCLNSYEQVMDAKDLEVDSQDEAKEIYKERQEIEDVAQEKQTEPYANDITKNLAEPDKAETEAKQEDTRDSQEKAEGMPAEGLENDGKDEQRKETEPNYNNNQETTIDLDDLGVDKKVDRIQHEVHSECQNEVDVVNTETQEPSEIDDQGKECETSSRPDEDSTVNIAGEPSISKELLPTYPDEDQSNFLNRKSIEIFGDRKEATPRTDGNEEDTGDVLSVNNKVEETETELGDIESQESGSNKLKETYIELDSIDNQVNTSSGSKDDISKEVVHSILEEKLDQRNEEDTTEERIEESMEVVDDKKETSPSTNDDEKSTDAISTNNKVEGTQTEFHSIDNQENTSSGSTVVVSEEVVHNILEEQLDQRNQEDTKENINEESTEVADNKNETTPSTNIGEENTEQVIPTNNEIEETQTELGNIDSQEKTSIGSSKVEEIKTEVRCIDSQESTSSTIVDIMSNKVEYSKEQTDQGNEVDTTEKRNQEETVDDEQVKEDETKDNNNEELTRDVANIIASEEEIHHIQQEVQSDSQNESNGINFERQEDNVDDEHVKDDETRENNNDIAKITVSEQVLHHIQQEVQSDGQNESNGLNLDGQEISKTIHQGKENETGSSIDKASTSNATKESSCEEPIPTIHHEDQSSSLNEADDTSKANQVETEIASEEKEITPNTNGNEVNTRGYKDGDEPSEITTDSRQLENQNNSQNGSVTEKESQVETELNSKDNQESTSYASTDDISKEVVCNIQDEEQRVSENEEDTKQKGNQEPSAEGHGAKLTANSMAILDSEEATEKCLKEDIVNSNEEKREEFDAVHTEISTALEDDTVKELNIWVPHEAIEEPIKYDGTTIPENETEHMKTYNRYNKGAIEEVEDPQVKSKPQNSTTVIESAKVECVKEKIEIIAEETALEEGDTTENFHLSSLQEASESCTDNEIVKFETAAKQRIINEETKIESSYSCGNVQEIKECANYEQNNDLPVTKGSVADDVSKESSNNIEEATTSSAIEVTTVKLDGDQFQRENALPSQKLEVDEVTPGHKTGELQMEMHEKESKTPAKENIETPASVDLPEGIRSNDENTTENVDAIPPPIETSEIFISNQENELAEGESDKVALGHITGEPLEAVHTENKRTLAEEVREFDPVSLEKESTETPASLDLPECIESENMTKNLDAIATMIESSELPIPKQEDKPVDKGVDKDTLGCKIEEHLEVENGKENGIPTEEVRESNGGPWEKQDIETPAPVDLLECIKANNENKTKNIDAITSADDSSEIPISEEENNGHKLPVSEPVKPVQDPGITKESVEIEPHGSSQVKTSVLENVTLLASNSTTDDIAEGVIQKDGDSYTLANSSLVEVILRNIACKEDGVHQQQEKTLANILMESNESNIAFNKDESSEAIISNQVVAEYVTERNAEIFPLEHENNEKSIITDASHNEEKQVLLDLPVSQFLLDRILRGNSVEESVVTPTDDAKQDEGERDLFSVPEGAISDVKPDKHVYPDTKMSSDTVECKDKPSSSTSIPEDGDQKNVNEKTKEENQKDENDPARESRDSLIDEESVKSSENDYKENRTEVDKQEGNSSNEQETSEETPANTLNTNKDQDQLDHVSKKHEEENPKYGEIMIVNSSISIVGEAPAHGNYETQEKTLEPVAQDRSPSVEQQTDKETLGSSLSTTKNQLDLENKKDEEQDAKDRENFITKPGEFLVGEEPAKSNNEIGETIPEVVKCSFVAEEMQGEVKEEEETEASVNDSQTDDMHQNKNYKTGPNELLVSKASNRDTGSDGMHQSQDANTEELESKAIKHDEKTDDMHQKTEINPEININERELDISILPPSGESGDNAPKKESTKVELEHDSKIKANDLDILEANFANKETSPETERQEYMENFEKVSTETLAITNGSAECEGDQISKINEEISSDASCSILENSDSTEVKDQKDDNLVQTEVTIREESVQLSAEETPDRTMGNTTEKELKSNAVQPSMVIHESVKDQVASNVLEEKVATFGKDDLGETKSEFATKEDKTAATKDEKTFEEHLAEEYEIDTPLMVEIRGQPKPVNKKHQNKLSEVGSKMKHSIISKVKKAITCTSSNLPA